MSLFNQGQTAGTGSSVAQAATANPPRGQNLSERVMEQHQRICALEQSNMELRQGCEKLVKLLISQLGLVI